MARYKEKGVWCGVVVVVVVVWGGVVYRRTQTIIYSIKPLYQFYNPKTRKDLTHLGENDEGVPDLDEAAWLQTGNDGLKQEASSKTLDMSWDYSLHAFFFNRLYSCMSKACIFLHPSFCLKYLLLFFTYSLHFSYQLHSTSSSRIGWYHGCVAVSCFKWGSKD